MTTLLVVERTIGGSICAVAVPLFYVISGYLFFIKRPECFGDIMPKIKKRCRTLLVPYLLANILTFLFYVVLNLITRYVPTFDSIVNFKVLDTVVAEGVWPTVKLVFIDPPIAFQLWFVRDLMVVVFFSPLIFLLLKWTSKRRITANIIFALLIACIIFQPEIPFGSATLWFTLGGALAMNRTDLSTSHDAIYSIPALVIYLLLCGFNGFGLLPVKLMILIPVIGIIALWYAYDAIESLYPCLGNNRYLLLASKYTFFVYLCHEPLLNIFKKLPLLISRSEPTFIIAYISIPILFYLIACVVGRWIKGEFPKLYSIYTGGR